MKKKFSLLTTDLYACILIIDIILNEGITFGFFFRISLVIVYTNLN